MAVNENIGHLGTGTINHNGGNNIITNGLVLGVVPSATGFYNLNSGVLETEYETVGVSGTGIFTQSGGTTMNTVNKTLYVGLNAGGSGIYTLGGGLLAANKEYIGLYGAGAFNQTGGLHNVTGDLIIAGNAGGQGAYSLTGGTLVAGNIVNNDTFNYSGGALNLAAGGSGLLTNNADFNLSGAGIRTVNGDVTNYGTVNVTNTTVNWLGTYTELGAYVSDPSNNYFTDLTVGGTGYLLGGAGDNFYIGGNFTNNSTQYSLWDTANSYLGFTGTATHTMSITGSSMAGNFSFGTIEVLSGGSLNLTGSNFYVNNLVLSAGSTIDLGGINLYYTSLTNYGGTYLGGQLLQVADISQVPEPGTMLLLVAGLVGLVGLKRRFKGIAA